MAEFDKSISDVENSVRDFKNWLSAFKTEYDIAPEAMNVLHDKLDEFSEKCKGIKSDKSGNVDPSSIKPVSNILRDIRNWLAAFASEYDLSKEAIAVLTAELDGIGKKLAEIK